MRYFFNGTASNEMPHANTDKGPLIKTTGRR